MDTHKKIVIVRTAGTVGLIGNIITLNIPAVIGFILCWAENKRMIKSSGIFYAIAAFCSLIIVIVSSALTDVIMGAQYRNGILFHIFVILAVSCMVMNGIFSAVLLKNHKKIERDKYFD